MHRFRPYKRLAFQKELQEKVNSEVCKVQRKELYGENTVVISYYCLDRYVIVDLRLGYCRLHGSKRTTWLIRAKEKRLLSA